MFEFSRFRHSGREVLYLTLSESILASVLVTVGILALGQPWQVALLLGAVAIATAPASTLMVIRECDSAGPLTENILGIIAVNNLFCITAYALVAATIDLASGLGGTSLFDAVYRAAYPLVWQLVGSAALGLPRRPDAGRVVESGDRDRRSTDPACRLDPALRRRRASSRSLPLVASLAVGATMVNLAERSRRLFDTLSGTDPPFYAIFFVIAGADLDLTLIPTMGVIGLVYVSGRGHRQVCRGGRRSPDGCASDRRFRGVSDSA